MPGREMRALGDSGEDSPHRSHSASSVVTAIDHVRWLINVRIRASLPGERGEIAMVLITGERAGMQRRQRQVYARDRGMPDDGGDESYDDRRFDGDPDE